MRSISRVPRCQQRNNNRLRRSSRPPLDRVDPVIVDSNPNAKSPDVPGRVDITSVLANVSRCSPYKFTMSACPLRKRSAVGGKLICRQRWLAPSPLVGEGWGEGCRSIGIAQPLTAILLRSTPVMYGRPPVGKAFLVFRQTDRGAVMYTASRCGRWPRALMENADRIPIIAARCYAR